MTLLRGFSEVSYVVLSKRYRVEMKEAFPGSILDSLSARIMMVMVIAPGLKKPPRVHADTGK